MRGWALLRNDRLSPSSGQDFAQDHLSGGADAALRITGGIVGCERDGADFEALADRPDYRHHLTQQETTRRGELVHSPLLGVEHVQVDVEIRRLRTAADRIQRRRQLQKRVVRMHLADLGPIQQVDLGGVQVAGADEADVGVGDGAKAGDGGGHGAPAAAGGDGERHPVQKAAARRIRRVEVRVGIQPDHRGARRAEAGEGADGADAVAGEDHRERAGRARIADGIGDARGAGPLVPAAVVVQREQVAATGLAARRRQAVGQLQPWLLRAGPDVELRRREQTLDDFARHTIARLSDSAETDRGPGLGAFDDLVRTKDTTVISPDALEHKLRTSTRGIDLARDPAGEVEAWLRRIEATII